MSCRCGFVVTSPTLTVLWIECQCGRARSNPS